jgi:uncharacterized protein (TIGR03435 family)
MVLDETGLTGKYDINLTWTPEKGLPPPPRPDPNGPSLFTALQEQLGLKLSYTAYGKTIPLEPVRQENQKALGRVKEKSEKAGCK